MTISVRRRLRAFFGIVFVILSTYLLLASQGIRFDPLRLTFQRTGGIYASALPTDAEIFLDGERVGGGSGVFRRGVFIDDLLPDTYALRVERDGYYSYEKQIPVEPGRVAQAPLIVLAPRTMLPASEPLAPTPESTASIFQSDAGTYFLHDGTSGSLLNINLLFTNLKTRQLGLPGSVPLTLAQPHPFDAQKLVIASERAVYLMDVRRLTIEAIADMRPIRLVSHGNELLWTASTADGTALYAHNLLLKTTRVIIEHVAGANAEIILSPSARHVVLRQTTGAAVLVSRQTGRTSVLSSDAERILFSSDGSAVAVVGSDARTILSYAVAEDVAHHFAPESGGVREIVWYRDSAHLFVRSSDGSVYFIDIDPRAPTYAPRIAENAATIRYLSSENILYIESAADGRWYAMDFNF